MARRVMDPQTAYARRRVNLGISREAFSRWVFVNATMLEHIELGRREPSPGEARRIEAVLSLLEKAQVEATVRVQELLAS